MLRLLRALGAQALCKLAPTNDKALFRQASHESNAKLEVSIQRRNRMPVIAWLLGVPLSVVLILMLFGVF